MEDLGNRICFSTHRIKLSNGDIIKCSKKVGANLPFPIPFLEDKEVCVCMNFTKTEHVIPDREIDIYKIYNCPNRKIFGKKEEELIKKFHVLIEYKEGFY
ncbi:MAG: hypothetical protein AABX99_01300, partial [Nanoarchaeota archaeon]